MNSWQAFRRALDRLTLYLPLMVMAVLAMGSWWLVRSMPDLVGGPVQRQVRKDPDYHLEKFSTQVFDAQGRRIRQVSGEQAHHYPDSDELHIDGIRLLTVNAQGPALQATARRGIVTGDGERVTLEGQVYVLREASGAYPRIELRSERLVALQGEDRLVSDVPVQITRERDRFTASALDFDLQSGQYRLDGRVRGVLEPRQP